MPLINPASGSEQVLYHQATGLALEGNYVFAITRMNSDYKSIEFKQYNNVQNACYSLKPKNFFSAILEILREPPHLFDRIKNETSFSIAIAHQPLNCFSLILSGKLKKMPLLYVCHSPSHLEYELNNEAKSFFRFWPQVILRKKIERFCLKKSSIIMVLSRYMKEKINHIHQISAPIVVNPGGVDLKRFQPISTREKIKITLGLPTNRIHLLTVRNLEPRMGIDNLIKSIAILKKGGEFIHLTICGDGPEKKNLESLIHDLNLEKEISFTGFIGSELLPKYYCAADFFILPTRKLEGFGLVTPESMACGTPVLGTPVGGTREILSNFNPHLLFKDSSPEAMATGIESAIDHYFNDHDKYNKLRLRCREYTEKNYSWQRHTKQLISIINETI